jgi:hydroxypyruvate reductase
LTRAGFAVRTLPDCTGEVSIAAEHYAMCARGLRDGEAAVAVGEPTVVLPARPGRGGRAGRLALLVAQKIDGLSEIGFLAGATDGVDGESGHAGAVVSGHTLELARAHGIDATSALAAFDDARAHEALATTLTPGPTGINLLDVHVVARRAE